MKRILFNYTFFPWKFKRISNVLMSFILVLSFNSLNATNYYVSNSGNDSNSGTSESSPWKTISKVNASTYKAGDQILFKRGDTWREQMYFPSSGTNGNPIIIASYGDGNKPIFSSPILSVSWTNLGSGRYSAPIAYTQRFFWENSIHLPKATSTALNDGNWYYTGGTIYYRPTTGVPTDHVLNYAPAGTGGVFCWNSINVSDKSYVTISGLSFNLVGMGVVTFDQGAGTNTIKIENCDFIGCWRGVFFMPDVNSNTNAIITNNYFKWCQAAIGMYSTEAIGGSAVLTHKNISPVISYNKIYEGGTTNGTTHWKTGFTDWESIGLQNVSGGQIHHNHIRGGYQIAYMLFNLSSVPSDGNHFNNNIVEDITNIPIVFTGRSGSASFNGNWISYNIFKNNGGGESIRLVSGCFSKTNELLCK